MKLTTTDSTILDITALSHDGRGIATLDGITVFVENALPNEKVACQISKKHRNYLEAKTLNILNPSPERVTPHCPHFGICGGCSMQHIAMENQVQFKQQSLLDQLQRLGKVTPEEMLTPISGPTWGYRRKARLGVRYVRKKERVIVGFREKNSRYLACLETCPVLHPTIGERLNQLSELIASLTQYEHIPQIEVAIGDKEAALVFRHMTLLPPEDLKRLIDFGKKYQLSIYLQPNPPDPITKLWPEDNKLLLSYSLPQYNLTMYFHPLDFVQVNGEINQALINQAMTLLDPQPTETILDLFCGLGNFTLPLARSAKHVTGIEGDKIMVERAQYNAEFNGIHNVEFHSANLMEPEKIPLDKFLKRTYDKILIDPPRTGAIEIIPYLINLSAKRIVYVSCNPSTLARDAAELVFNQGYILKQAGVVNMFPHTNHIEAIAVFESKKSWLKSKKNLSETKMEA